MNIGLDAKRAFHNGTGLGVYSRTLINGLARYYPQHHYFLFNPKPSTQLFNPAFANVREAGPTSFGAKLFPAVWRSGGVNGDLKKLGIDIYHGLSHEIPFGIEKTDIPSVVTMHDLIFERYPKQFNPIDVRIYRKKFQYACRHANRVIAISQQTKKDLVQVYNIPEQKIDVCYQSCNPAFAEKVSVPEKETLRKKYDLPPNFFLYVGSIIERKNLLGICQALVLLRGTIDVPLVVVGNGGTYKRKVQTFIQQQGLTGQVIFLSDKIEEQADPDFRTTRSFPALFQMAIALVYPSFFEGFGIPVLEALWSRLPVITSNTSCLPETGGDAAYYINPAKPEELATALKTVYENAGLRHEMQEKGWQHAQQFTLQQCTEAVMNVYQKVTR